MNKPPTSLANWNPAPDLLQDRVVLVTGAAQGIGRAVSRTLAAHGATTILLDRDVAGLERAYDEIRAAGLPEPALYPLDLQGAGPEDYQALATTLQQEFQRLDGLIHNAALLGALVPLANFDDELWFQTLQVNLNAPYLLTRACLDLLCRSQDAAILFTADAAGRTGKAYWGAYAVAKAGQEAMMQILADELEQNTPVRVNSIDPGPVRTALRLLAYPAEDQSKLKLPQDVTKPFLYLVGPDSKGITGQQFTVAELL
jgi:NAD(P)-dependent dehydrogenase (short-subunit alcohol dehydrogenase family)